MKLTLRPEWRLRPLSSFLGFLDLKTGVTIVVLFALLNKVAGVYGLIAVLTGAGGSAAQLSLYIYSTVALVALAWGLNAVAQEDAKKTLYFAHAFFADHIVSTAWVIFFTVVWWKYTPHDGRQQIFSPAQREIMEAGGGGHSTMTPEERAAAATEIWNHEKGTAMAFIIVGFICKIYFAFLLYSYAIHLRKGSYRSLAYSRPLPSPSYTGVSTVPDDEDDVEAFYHVPVRPSQSGGGHGHTPSGSSISSFADFVSAPGRSRRFNNQRTQRKPSALNPATAKGPTEGADEVDEVLFDEDELLNGNHLKAGTDESASASGSGGRVSADEETTPFVGNERGGSSGRRLSRARP